MEKSRKVLAAVKRRKPISCIGLTYIIFVLLVLLQYQSIFLAHDDYGYAVLSYRSSQQGFQGQEFTLADVAAFLTNEYKAWTGRIASHLLHIYAQKIGLDFVRLLQSLAISSVALLSFLLARGPGRPYSGGDVLFAPFPCFYSWPCLSGYNWEASFGSPDPVCISGGALFPGSRISGEKCETITCAFRAVVFVLRIIQ